MKPSWIVGCGCILILGYYFGIPFLVQMVWAFFRPDQPLPYHIAFAMWFLIGSILAYFSRK